MKTVACLLFIFSNLALPVDCEWSPWTFEECSSSCGGGNRNKIRSIKAEETHGGKCVGNRIEVAPCSTQSCPGKVINKNGIIINMIKINFSLYLSVYYLSMLYF